MEFKVDGNPCQGDLSVALTPGEHIMSEAGAMSRMSAHLETTPRLTGGMLSAVARKFLGGESMFLTEYKATDRPGFVALSPSLPGTVISRELNGDSFMLTKSCYLASTDGITISMKFGGLKSLFSGEGAFLIEVSGTGTLFYTAYGALEERKVDGTLVVDTGHLVAFETSLDYSIGGMGGIKQTLFSGEGLVMRFEGTGTVYLQTRTLGGAAGWLSGYCR